MMNDVVRDRMIRDIAYDAGIKYLYATLIDWDQYKFLVEGITIRYTSAYGTTRGLTVTKKDRMIDVVASWCASTLKFYFKTIGAYVPDREYVDKLITTVFKDLCVREGLNDSELSTAVTQVGMEICNCLHKRGGIKQ